MDEKTKQGFLRRNRLLLLMGLFNYATAWWNAQIYLESTGTMLNLIAYAGSICAFAHAVLVRERIRCWLRGLEREEQ